MVNFKFVARGAELKWVHVAELLATDVDCTDMSDAEFEAQVCRTVGIFKFARVPA